MTDRDALYESILDAPADDAPRLVFADWLTENGEPERAAFVRGHVERGLGPFTSLPGRAITFSYSPEIDFYVQAGDVGTVEVAPAIPGVTWVVRRGFPHTVRLTLAALMGGPCERCEGEGEAICDEFQAGDQTVREWDTCPTCHGTGRRPGVAERLAELPLERVELTDKTPISSEEGSRVSRWTTDEQSPTMSWNLPVALFELLPTGEGAGCTLIRDAGVNWSSRFSVRDYESTAAARAALSAACLAYIHQHRTANRRRPAGVV